jgi:hypothetical protein
MNKKQEEFNLSEKIQVILSGDILDVKDVKEFIRLLKEDDKTWEFRKMAREIGMSDELIESLDFGAIVGLCGGFFDEKIDKLAGDKLK